MRKQTQRVTVNASGHIAHGRVKGESKSSLPISKSLSSTSLLSMPVLARAQCSLRHLPLLKINDNHSQEQPLTVRVLGSCGGLEMPGLNLPRSEVSATMPISQMSRLKPREISGPTQDWELQWSCSQLHVYYTGLVGISLFSIHSFKHHLRSAYYL